MACSSLKMKFLSKTTLILSIPRLVSALPQNQTNGLSQWGTLEVPTFPDFLDSSTYPNRFPWGSATVENSNPLLYTPSTQVTRIYDFTVTRAVLAPDGYEKHGIFVNGQFPGPAIEANWGDTIQVTLHNNITQPEEGTSLHWHGIRQRGNQYYDGVPSVTQCPVAPGASFTYRFTADMYGTSWYHAHYSAQYTAGIFGPMVIYGPKHVPYDIDLGPVIVGDHYHKDYFDVLEAVAGNSSDFTIYVPTSDNSLINGKNNYNCSLANRTAPCYSNAGLSRYRFTSGKSHRLRLINAGAAALIHFSIDEHSLLVISNDFTPLVPYETDVVTLHVGQRTDVVVEGTGNATGAYWMRSSISLNCSVSTTTQGLGVILYEKATETVEPETSANTAAKTADEKSNVCTNDDLEKTVPVYPVAVNDTPDTTETIEIDLITNSSGHHIWTMNNQTQRSDYNKPILLLADQKNFSYPLDPEWNVYNFGSNKTIHIVMNNKYQSPHPMHLHGHAFSVLSEGDGFWDGKTIINPSNPLRRDVHNLRRFGHLVIQFQADNPGVWPYHCHIAWHASMGYTLNVLELPQNITQMQIPEVMARTCVDWDAYTQLNVVDQIDSGI